MFTLTLGSTSQKCFLSSESNLFLHVHCSSVKLEFIVEKKLLKRYKRKKSNLFVVIFRLFKIFFLKLFHITYFSVPEYTGDPGIRTLETDPPAVDLPADDLPPPKGKQ